MSAVALLAVTLSSPFTFHNSLRRHHVGLLPLEVAVFVFQTGTGSPEMAGILILFSDF